MSEQNSYSHIKVTPPDEEDVVIYAGAAHQNKADQSDAQRHVSAQSASKVQHNASEYNDTCAAHGQASGRSAADAAKTHTKAARSERDSYKETTLEDIEGSKMSTTQKVIIVLAILAVIAFVVYSVFYI